MRNLIAILLTAVAATVLSGCTGSTPNDDPKASIAGTNKFRHQMPGGGGPSPVSRPDMSKQ